MAKHTGVRKLHSRSCRKSRVACDARATTARTCAGTWEAAIYSKRDGKKIRRVFDTRDAAIAWRAESMTAVKRGALRASTSLTLEDTAAAFLEGAKAGTVRTRSGSRYKPSVVRSYASALRTRRQLPREIEPLSVLDLLGRRKLTSITRLDLQNLVKQLLAIELDPSTIRNVLLPLRCIYREALDGGDVMFSPLAQLKLPKVTGRRERVATPTEGTELLAALPEDDRALWAIAAYGGLRAGEIRGIEWSAVDVDGRVIHVRRGWDDIEGPIDPKYDASIRDVPMAAMLRTFLVEHRARTGRSDGLVFSVDGKRPFTPSAVRRRARKAWERARIERAAELARHDGRELDAVEPAELERCVRRAGFVPIGLHECRHSFASYLDAAGLSRAAIDEYMGHADASIGGRYRHALPGRLAEDAARLDAYLAGATSGKVVPITTGAKTGGHPLQAASLSGS